MRVTPPGALLLLGACAVAQQSPPATVRDVVLHGRVLDAGTHAPIAAAQVEIVGEGAGNITNDDGYFELRVRAPLPGRIRVRAVSIGYTPDVREIDVAPGRNLVDFALTPTRAQIEALIIEGERSARMVPPPGPPPYPGWDREQYAHITENDFVSPATAPLSTFGADVDRASYANVRRILREGRLPPAGAVRIEEMINYFDYDYPAPEGETPFAVTSELVDAPWREGHLLLRIGIQAERVEVTEMPPANLVFLIDVSGSMHSPDKLPLVRQSFPLLVEQLRPEDRVAIVVYAGAAGVVLPSTPAARTDEILAAIDRLEAGGSTAGGAGLRLAYSIARDNFVEGGNNRVILATDGDFNVGESSDDAMTRLVEEQRASGVFLSVLGFGTGNLQDAKMEAMADNGNGNFFYVDDLREARKVFVQEIAGTLVTVAKDVKLQIEFNPQHVAGYRLIGYENRALADHEFDDDSVDSGDIGAGHSVTALYEIVPIGVESDVAIRTTAELRYQQTAPSDASSSDELAYVRIRYKEPDGAVSRLIEVPVATTVSEASEDVRFAAAVAGFGMLLRGSEHSGGTTIDMIRGLARSGRGVDELGYRTEFIDLVDRYARLRTVEAEN